MKILPSPIGPVFQYDTVEELTYNLLNTMGLSTRPDGVVIDTELNTLGGVEVKISGKLLKATIDQKRIMYAGEGELMLDILSNYKILSELLGLFLDKKKEFEDVETLSFYPIETVDQNEIPISNMNVKFSNNEIYESDYFHNRCLSLVHMIFIIGDINVDLHNFDTLETK